MPLVILDHVRPTNGGARRDALPVLKSALYTLDISVRFLAAATVGRDSVEYGDRLLDGYWRRIFQSGNAKLLVEGREHFDGRPAIVVSNHSSMLDIPALMGAVPGSLRMVLKEELTRVPIWGPALIKSGFVPVRRGTKEAVSQLAEAERIFAQGVHIWIAPEGTRSRTGELLPFKKGAFHLARSLGAPIIPTWIDGTSRIVPPDRLTAGYDMSVLVRFGTPIVARADGRLRDVEELSAETRAAMLALRAGRVDARAQNGRAVAHVATP
jgi:1-acyl-sn-glycerol-3-phosphate acyltransferase